MTAAKPLINAKPNANPKRAAKAKGSAKSNGKAHDKLVTLRIRSVDACADKLRNKHGSAASLSHRTYPARRMCAANNKHPERKHFFFFFFALSLDICQAKQIEFAARSFEFAARCRRSTLPCNRIEIKIPNPPESPVIVIDGLPPVFLPSSF